MPGRSLAAQLWNTALSNKRFFSPVPHFLEFPKQRQFSSKYKHVLQQEFLKESEKKKKGKKTKKQTTEVMNLQILWRGRNLLSPPALRAVPVPLMGLEGQEFTLNLVGWLSGTLSVHRQLQQLPMTPGREAIPGGQDTNCGTMTFPAQPSPISVGLQLQLFALLLD